MSKKTAADPFVEVTPLEFEKRVQDRAVAAVASCLQRRDVSAANQLLEGLAKAPRGRKARNAVIAFLERHAPLLWDEKARRFSFDKSDARLAEPTARLLDEAKHDSWKKYNKPKEPGPLDVLEKLRSLISEVEGAKRRGRAIRNEELLAKLLDVRAGFNFPPQEPKSGDTVFDKSIKQTPMSASKHASGRDEVSAAGMAAHSESTR
ncbi:MAG: hypothetical protein U5L03_03070 [Burkholderiaceae bacterium]|nr:hypothetical protein [Burkholderiaceae bacterium]